MVPSLFLHFQNYWYAATQAKTECFCANEYDLLGPADNCDMACGGDSSQICGGAWALSVYLIATCKLQFLLTDL